MTEIERFAQMVKHCEEMKPCAECPMVRECNEAGMPHMTQKMMDEILEHDATIRALAECVEGAVKRYIYFCMKRSPQRDKLPQDGLIAFVDHGERRYIPRIDDVAWGLAIYSRELMPWEIARYELRANPRDA